MRSKLDPDAIYERIETPQPHYAKISMAEWEQRWSWETEWSRRQAALLDHQAECDRCRRAA
jgi:hypothetical protein